MTEYIDCKEMEDFRDELVSRFIGLCNGNDFNRVNLLKITETIDKTFNKYWSNPSANVAEIVMCKDCIHAVEHKYSPAFFKCNGCSFLRGRLVSSTFWCKCGERR